MSVLLQYHTIAICYKSLSVGCLWSILLRHYRSFINTSVSDVSRRLSTGVLSTMRLRFLDLTCSIVKKCTLTHVRVYKHQAHFSCEIFQFEKPFFDNKFQKLSAVSNTVSIAHFYSKMLCYFQSKVPIAGWEINLGSKSDNFPPTTQPWLQQS